MVDPRGERHARCGLHDINAYLLGRDGPFLTPGWCDWIAQLQARPLRLYRITDVQAGAGIDGHLALSGVIDRFSKLAEAPVLAQARQVLAGSVELSRHSGNQRDLLELAIARAWLDQWFAAAPLPQIQDASTGDPLRLVTDHDRMGGAAALAAALASQPDVSGDAQQGPNRMATCADGALRSLSTINPGISAHRIKLFHRTQLPARPCST